MMSFETLHCGGVQALFSLFLVALVVYVLVTGTLIIAVYRIPDFHHGGFCSRFLARGNLLNHRNDLIDVLVQADLLMNDFAIGI